MYNDNDIYEDETDLSEEGRLQLAKEQSLIEEMEDEANAVNGDNEPPQRKLLRRELQAQALARLEDSARTQQDFERVVAWWDRLDANRERRERYHEISRSGDDIPLDYGACADALCFPHSLNSVIEKQIRKGDFIDAIFYCPYDIHQLVTEEYLSEILRELSDDHKLLLFLCAIRQLSSAKIAEIKGQSDRNIRKVRSTMLKRIRKKLLTALTEKAQKQQSLTLLEKEFLKENGIDIDFDNKK